MQVKDSNQRRKRIVFLAVLCAVLQLALAPNVGILSGRINFALIFGACIALSQGGPAGVFAGFFSGLFFDMCATSPVGLMALLLTASCYLMGTGVRNRFAEDASESLRLFAIGNAAVQIGYGLAQLMVGEASSLVEVLAFRAIPSFVLNLIAFIPFMMLMSRRDGGSMFRGGSSFGGSHSKPRFGGRR